MTFSRQWDTAYTGKKRATWPWSDLVSYVSRYASPADGFQRVLELGCGAGANIPFFIDQNVRYCGIEGSSVIVARLHEAFPDLRKAIVVGDFTVDIPFDGPFDLVIDRASVSHNDTKAVGNTLDMVFALLRPGGKFIGIDWFSTEQSDAKAGDEVDAHTRNNIPAGRFAGVGNVHFSDQQHISEMLAGAGLRLERLEHKKNIVVIPPDGEQPAWWNFVAVKP